MRRLRPDDDYFIRLETDQTPHHIGSLQLYDLAGRSPYDFFAAVRNHFEKRLPATPLLCRHRSAPFRYDADVWMDVAACDLDEHIERIEPDHPLSRSELHAFVDERVVHRLDLSKPPFKVLVIDRVEDGRAAVFMMVHHSVADGIGFQNIMASILDDTPTPTYASPTSTRDERPPSALLWLALSALRFRREAREEAARASERDEARAVFRAFRKDPTKARAATPELAMAKQTSGRRRYTSMSLPFERIRLVGKALGGTVNDAFLTIATGALRRCLGDSGESLDAPLVAVAARSYRKPEHGDFGNRIITLNPALPVHLENPVDRFRAIQASMAIELERAALTEPLISEFDKPFGARDRYRQYAARTAGGSSVMQGNVTLSTVPGPAGSVYLAGFELLANYPAPILGSGRFLNITLRRYRDQLDLGIMTDPEQLADPERLRTQLLEALEELEGAGSVV
jgi:diacylglycerol O-acyltransferase / wax synthase